MSSGPQGLLVMPRLSTGWPGAFRVSSPQRESQQACWTGARAGSSPLPNEELPFSPSVSPHPPGRNLWTTLLCLPIYPLENVTHSLTFLPSVINAPQPTCVFPLVTTFVLSFSWQPLDLGASSATHHSHRKELHWQRHSGGLGHRGGESYSMKGKMTAFILREELNELSDIPHFNPRVHSSPILIHSHS